MATELTYSPTVQSAIDDPDGVRQALRRYGEALGWPANAIAPIPCGSGAEAWITALLKFPPLWLGQAWERIEQTQRRAVKYRRPEATAQSQDERTPQTMPVLQPSATGSMIEPGNYRAVITEINETTSTFDGKETAQLQFQWVLLDSDGDKTDQQIRGWCSAKWHERSKLYEWSRAILGKKCPAATDPFDSDRLIGRKADLEIVAYRKQDGSDGTKIGKVWPFGSMTKTEEDDAA